MTLRETLTSRQSLVFLGIWLVLNIAAGVGLDLSGAGDGGIAWEAHIGGMLAGLFGLALFDRPSPRHVD